MKFWKGFLGVTLKVITHTHKKEIHSIVLSAGCHFEVFCGSFLCMFLCFVRTVQFFLMKFYADVIGIFLTFTTIKRNYHVVSCSAGTRSDICSSIFCCSARTRSDVCSSIFCEPFCWGLFLGVFGPIVFVSVPLMPPDETL